MEALEALLTRRSVRAYEERMPEQDLIDKVMEAGLYAKSSPNHVYDGALMMGNLMNAAHAVGLGSCWINRAKQTFEREDGKQMLKEWGIKGDYEGIGFCILGYAAKEGKTAPRKANRIFYVK